MDRRKLGVIALKFAAAFFVWAGGLVSNSAAQMVPVPDPDTTTDQPAIAVSIPASQPPIAPAPRITPNGPVPPSTPPIQSFPTVPAVSSIGTPSFGTGRFALVLNDGTRLIGAPSDVTTLPFEAAFGHIEIPIGTIRTVEFAADVAGTKTHRVHFINGDTITGTVGAGTVGPWEMVRFQTSYGQLTVPLACMVRMSADGAAKTPLAAAPSPVKQAAASGEGEQPVATGFVGRPVPVPFIEGAPGPIRPPRPVAVPSGDPE